MNNLVFVKPKEGLLVPVPNYHHPNIKPKNLNPEGDYVNWLDAYWHQMLRNGDIEVIEHSDK